MVGGRLFRAAVLAAAALLLFAQLLAQVLLTERNRTAALESAQETVDRVALSIESAVNRSLLQIDSMLLGLPMVLDPFIENGQLDAYRANRLLRELNNHNLALRDVLVVSQDGRPLTTALTVSRHRPLPLPLGPAFVAAGLPGAGLILGGPVRNPVTGEWSLFFAREMTLPGLGRVTGVAEVPVPVLAGLLTPGGETRGLRTTLELRSGTLLASVPHDENRIGRQLDRPSGVEPRDISRFDGRAVISADRPTLYPALAINVTYDLDVAMAGWAEERQRTILVTLALGVLVLAVAITLLIALRQRARVEEERLRWRQRLENALESMSDGFVMFDADDRLVICNQRYREMYNRANDYIHEGVYFDDMIRGGIENGQYPQFEGRDPDAMIAELKAWRRSGGMPIERLLPDGRWILITERPTPEGGTVGIRTDITALKQAMQEVEAAASSRTMFLARMSHELRTPLNAILGFAQLLLTDRSLGSAGQEQLRLLHDAGVHLRELVNGLLDLSKIDAGKLELEHAPVPLGPLVDSCAGLMRPETARREITLLQLRAPGLPEAVLGDATRLRQMLLNLLSNAVKFTPPGGRVELSLAPQRGAPGLVIEVRDTGPGVSAAQRDLLFRDFAQFGPAGDPDNPGTGLGLAITSRLAALMGGRVEVDHPSEGGALFRLCLPLPPADLPAPADPPVLPVARRSLRLLVADDIAANRLLMRALLTGAGHEVHLAKDGQEVLDALDEEGFDAVLMDVRMPGMDGLEATRRLRARPGPERRMPVIAVTASAMPEEVAECEAAGMDSHLTKPVDRHAMLEMLARLAAREPVRAAE